MLHVCHIRVSGELSIYSLVWRQQTLEITDIFEQSPKVRCNEVLLYNYVVCITTRANPRGAAKCIFSENTQHVTYSGFIGNLGLLNSYIMPSPHQWIDFDNLQGVPIKNDP